MHRCRCTKSKSSSIEPVMQLRKMVMVRPKANQNSRNNKSITINPWSPVKENHIAAIHKSSQNCAMEDYTDPAHMDKLGDCDNEPIYDEIEHLHSDGNIRECDLEANNNNKVNELCKEDDSEGIKSKKHKIIYWQITAKEVATFKPCTETFIDRD